MNHIAINGIVVSLNNDIWSSQSEVRQFYVLLYNLINFVKACFLQGPWFIMIFSKEINNSQYLTINMPNNLYLTISAHYTGPAGLKIWIWIVYGWNRRSFTILSFNWDPVFLFVCSHYVCILATIWYQMSESLLTSPICSVIQCCGLFPYVGETIDQSEPRRRD